MINFVNGSAANTLRYHGDDSAYAGMLRTPESGNRVENAVELGMSWVLDNGCFSKYDPPAILRMLHRFRGVGGCKFATVPDVVGDHAATILLFRAWVGTYRALGYPPAFVLQDGVSIHTVPWDSIDAVFVGGSTAFKYSDQIREIVTEANRRNKWVHMGRVNSAARWEGRRLWPRMLALIVMTFALWRWRRLVNIVSAWRVSSLAHAANGVDGGYVNDELSHVRHRISV